MLKRSSTSQTNHQHQSCRQHRCSLAIIEQNVFLTSYWTLVVTNQTHKDIICSQYVWFDKLVIVSVWTNDLLVTVNAKTWKQDKFWFWDVFDEMNFIFRSCVTVINMMWHGRGRPQNRTGRRPLWVESPGHTFWGQKINSRGLFCVGRRGLVHIVALGIALFQISFKLGPELVNCLIYQRTKKILKIFRQ